MNRWSRSPGLLRRALRGAPERWGDPWPGDVLLEALRSMQTAATAEEAAVSAARAALRLADARAVFVVAKERLLAAEGRDASKLREELGEPLLELAGLVSAREEEAIVDPGERGGGEDGRGPVGVAVLPLPGALGESVPAALCVVHDGPAQRLDAAYLPGLRALAGVAAVALRAAALRDLQRNFFSHTTEILVGALDAYLDYHAGHGPRVARAANHLGRALGLGEEPLRRLHFAALLHDLGMLRIQRTKRYSRRVCRRHAQLGARMLSGISVWADLAPLVRHHHEWFDGSGYPDGLAGEEIPLEARIISVCDAFDSMTSATSYKRARPLEEAIAELDAGAGSQFDPRLVRRFRALVARGDIRVL